VVNRTLERAHALAQRWDAQAATFEHLHAELAAADILIASTGAPHTLISPAMVNETMQHRAERPLVLIDIAVPRDIDPDVANIPHVKLYDIDNLNAQLEHSLADRMAEVPQVKKILAEELELFREYLKSLDMLPLIDHIEAMTQALVNKILHAPTHHLHTEAASPRASEYAAVARRLFNLSDASTAAD